MLNSVELSCLIEKKIVLCANYLRYLQPRFTVIIILSVVETLAYLSIIMLEATICMKTNGENHQSTRKLWKWNDFGYNLSNVIVADEIYSPVRHVTDPAL